MLVLFPTSESSARVDRLDQDRPSVLLLPNPVTFHRGHTWYFHPFGIKSKWGPEATRKSKHSGLQSNLRTGS